VIFGFTLKGVPSYILHPSLLQSPGLSGQLRRVLRLPGSHLLIIHSFVVVTVFQ
jgi:hypothetical protein